MCQVPEEWWELYVQVPDHLSDAVGAYLHALGSEAVVFHEHMGLSPHKEPCIELTAATAEWVVLQGAIVGDTTFPAQLLTLQQFLSTCTQDSPGIQLYCRRLAALDYQQQWRQFFQSLCVGNRLLVRPPWDVSAVPEHLVDLTLDPGPAFGTGAHPSTHLCLQMLTQLAPQYQGTALFDVGCGSGILSLAALRLGWQSALGVDIDPQAIPVAIANAELNGLQTRAHYLQGSWNTVAGQFACITANIYLDPLLEMLQPLARLLAPGGLLILSGILESQEGILRTALMKAQLVVHTRLVAEGWLTLAVQYTPTTG